MSTPPLHAVTATPPPPAAPAPPEPLAVVEGSVFLQRIRIATYSIVLIYLTLLLLKEFRDILQPLFIAMFLGFLMHPIHRWLVQRGIPSLVAYGLIFVVVATAIITLSSIMYVDGVRMVPKLPEYEKKLESMIIETAKTMEMDAELEKGFLRRIQIAPDQLRVAGHAAFEPVRAFATLAGLTLLYLVFIIAERVSAHRRMQLAFGDAHGDNVVNIVESITQAISQYITVKTLVSIVAGVLSWLVLAAFDVPLAATWGILIFLLNYIPYIGSLIAIALPILLSFLELDWLRGTIIAVLLIAIQQVIGTFLEPKMAGQRLDVSPILIVLSLAFWGTVWGIVGAILAVPLLVSVKIILENIDATKPIATLISNK